MIAISFLKKYLDYWLLDFILSICKLFLWSLSSTIYGYQMIIQNILCIRLL